jgi:ATP-binding cassette subfamily F protein uup
VSAADQRTARKEVQRLERRMTQLAKRREQLHTRLAEAATDPDTLVALSGELEQVDAEVEQVELEWLEAAERAEL